MDFATLIDIVATLASTAVVFVGVWVRQLTGTISGLSSKLDRLQEDNSREHGMVEEQVRDLRLTLTEEVRGIVNQHSAHDKQNTRIETKIDFLHEKVGGIHANTGQDT